jgi:hypothetical protein
MLLFRVLTRRATINSAFDYQAFSLKPNIFSLRIEIFILAPDLRLFPGAVSAQ